jgi:hypothetical protein
VIIFGEEMFTFVVKVAISSNEGQNVCVIKISPLRGNGEIRENFLLVKISACIALKALCRIPRVL